MDIDTQAVYDEYCEAAKRVFDDIFAKYVKDLSGAFRRHACVIMRNIEMKALDSLQTAKSKELDIATDAYWDAKEVGSIGKHSQPTLPPEIIQYIISLAYDDDIKSLSSRIRNSGAVGLFGSICDETVDLPLRDFLLSTTTLSISHGRELYQATLIPHPKLKIYLSQDVPARYDLFDNVLSLSTRVKSLTLRHPSDLLRFLPVFPHLEEIKYLNSEEHIQEAGWKKLQQAVDTWERINLRSAAVASCHLAGFLSTGIFTNIVALHVHIDVYPHYLDECLDSLVQLRNLSSLQLEAPEVEILGSDYCEGQSREFRSLRKLVLISPNPCVAKCVLWRMSAVGLLEISFKKCRLLIDNAGEFHHDLSDKFPRLNTLRTTLDDIGRILCRRDLHGNILAWNFPNLHTLDIREASCDDTDIVFDWLPVLRARVSDEARSLGIAPINCFCVRRFRDYLRGMIMYDEIKEKKLDVERMLNFYEIEGIIPNFVSPIYDHFQEWFESVDYDFLA